MDVTQIPFNKFLEIVQSDTNNQTFVLKLNDNMKNHLGTFHASAQFALAEACSGASLLMQFPHLEHLVVPVLRKSEIKYKKPAQTDIQAKAHIAAEERENFEQQLEKKSRATIVVHVEIFDNNGAVTMSGAFEWFVHRL